MIRSLLTIAFGILLGGLGLVGGIVLTHRTAAAPGATKPEEAAGKKAEEDVLPPQTLKSIGVEIGEAKLETFTRAVRVQALITDRPLNLRPVVTQIGGIVTKVEVQTGRRVEAGQVLIQLARDPIPRPTLELTGDALAPVNEHVHAAAGAIRLAQSQVSVAEQELARIRPFIENRTIPRKTEIDLKYDLAKAQQQVANARTELKLHGLTDAEIAAVSRGESPPASRLLWRRALEMNDLWSARAQALFDALPARQRKLPWTIAALGELSAAGLISDAFVGATKQTPAVARHFVEVSGLLLAGMPMETIVLLAESGALEPRVELRAPVDGPPDWDVDTILVREGQRVAMGDEVMRLHDARRMWLRLEPIGQEIHDVFAAMASKTPFDATSLVPGSGPRLEGLHIARLGTREAASSRGGIAYAVARNTAQASGDGAAYRTWVLRTGLRYTAHIPTQHLEERFVLPADAVTLDGPNKIVFVQNGKTFNPVPVFIEHMDDEVAVIANDGSIFPGDPIVLHGAFALGLALKQGSGNAPVDPHAGHNHGGQ